METYELFDLPSDHWTWIAARELPWPHDGFGFVACCGRCGSLTYTPRATYSLAWDDAERHHADQRGWNLSPADPGGLGRHARERNRDSVNRTDGDDLDPPEGP